MRGGTSGIVVANRLSEDPNVQVLVLEAGQNHIDNPMVRIPGLCEGLKKTDGLKSELNSRGISIAHGKALRIQCGAQKHQMELEDPPPRTWIETFKRKCYNIIDNPFSGNPVGAFSCLASIDPKTKERSYSATAYYVPVAYRKNLRVVFGALVGEIIIDGTKAGQGAEGVQYQHDGHIITVKARNEVILAAGAFQSPKILELSGIGQSNLLEFYGVDVKIDSPYVGKNLQDHLVCTMGFETEEIMQTLDDLVRKDPQAIQAAMGEYLLHKTGPYTSMQPGSYAYLPVINFPFKEGQETLNELLYSTEPVGVDLSNPTAIVYHRIAKSIFEDREDSSAAFFTIPTQVVPARILSPGNLLQFLFWATSFQSEPYCLTPSRADLFTSKAPIQATNLSLIPNT
ncbi:MAG: hypothetical protein MMC33_004606 [Icmadophila ericetorum]|nr:hypothetical protein [Icmadophila ericetorum]